MLRELEGSQQEVQQRLDKVPFFVCVCVCMRARLGVCVCVCARARARSQMLQTHANTRTHTHAPHVAFLTAHFSREQARAVLGEHDAKLRLFVSRREEEEKECAAKSVE